MGPPGGHQLGIRSPCHRSEVRMECRTQPPHKPPAEGFEQSFFFFQRVTLTRKACRTLTVPYLAPTMPEGVSLKHCQTQLHQA